MDVYLICFDLKPDTDEPVFAEALARFLDHLAGEGRIERWRLLRCKLGLRPDAAREFMVLIETRDLAQLDRAFQAAAAREGETDRLHFAANGMVRHVTFALYRDWPDRPPAPPPG